MMCFCPQPPGGWPTLVEKFRVTEANVDIQIKLRRHLISCELVGHLYSSILRLEIENLLERFKNEKVR